MDDVRPRVDRVIEQFLERQRALVHQVSADAVVLLDTGARLLRGGKRLRPTFCYWGWRAVGGAPDDDAVLTAAAALELFQASALVHDDVIDGSDTRRGEPSAHRRFAGVHRDDGWRGAPDAFGAAAAVLLGDLLLGWSDELFDSAAVDAAGLRRARTVFNRMRTEVGSGQYLDVLEQASGASRPHGQAERARTVIRYKAARYSVEHPLTIGACLAGADDAALAPLHRYGAALGEAFQLRDDILGVFGDPDRTGKPAGDDLREGKRTVLVAYALERADTAQTELVERLLGDPALDPDGIERLCDVLVRTDALARVEARVAELVAEAYTALDTAQVTADGHTALARLIELATDRSR